MKSLFVDQSVVWWWSGEGNPKIVCEGSELLSILVGGRWLVKIHVLFGHV